MTGRDPDADVRWVRQRVADRLGEWAQHQEASGQGRPGRDPQRVYAQHLIGEELAELARVQVDAGRVPLDGPSEDHLATAVMDALFGLGVLERYLADPEVENICVNGADRVILYRADGSQEWAEPVARSDAALVELVKRAAARVGRSERRFDNGSPVLDLRLPGGSRLNAVMDVTDRPSLTVRRHRYRRVTLAELGQLGTLDRTLEDFLSAAVRARANLLVCGGTDAGKTTFLRALISAIDPSERLVVVEDDSELDLAADLAAHPNVVEMEAREANLEGQGAITMADLLRQTRRMRPDRVIVGEVRGPEVVQMLDAMSLGNDGSMCTLHADSTRTAFLNIAKFAGQATPPIPEVAVAMMVATSLDFVIHLHKPDRLGTRRAVSSVREITGNDGAMVQSNEVFAPGPDGLARPSIPLRDETSDRLWRAGFDPTRLWDRTGAWT